MAYDDTALDSALELGAWAVAAAGAGLLLLACAAEIVRRTRATSPLVALADRLLPTTSRRIAVILVTVVSATVSIVVPSQAHGDDDLRTWLTDGSSTTTPTTRPPTPSSTTTTPPPPTSTTSTTSSVPAIPRPVRDTPIPNDVTRAHPPAPPRASTVLRPRADAPPSEARRVDPPSPVVVAPDRVALPATADLGTPHTVVAGECLWSIAEAALGPGASARVVDRRWRAIYDANRGAIGADPNLIHPGLVLVLPPLDPTP